MPRAPQSRQSVPDQLAPNPHPNVLKRNQACHQVRVLTTSKSDAKRPCSTCVRSHTHALAHAAPGASLPPKPECTFDDAAEATTTVAESPKNRYERLENRINELEALLRQKESDSSSPGAQYSTMSQVGTSPQAMHSTLELNLAPAPSASPPIGNISPYSHGLDIVWPNWPPNLPGPELLRHLVDVFFVFHPHANRLFHAPSFMTALSLPPSHPKFPPTPVLHAICAVGSLYTAAVTSPPLPNFAEMEPDEIFSLKHRIKEERPDSFAEQQARYAKETAEQMNFLGQDLFQVLQASIVLCWFYWSHSKWVEVFLSSAHCIRLSVPLGLNMCPPFHSITNSIRPPSILPPARTVIEDETRRNAFWLAYAMERQHGTGNGWALSLDDQDVSQLLPVRGDFFEQGVLVPPHERQWAHSPDLLLVHSDEQTDSFVLYIKGTILICEVKAFNLRFRARHFAGDAAVVTPYSEGQQPTDPVDPRGSQAFIELDHIVSSFRASFPGHLRNPILNNVVDNHLYSACLIPYVSTIILHDPHAEVQQSGCLSALKILTAARAILDLIYVVWSTSYDITLLDSFCTFCWFVAGRVLVRFLQAAIDANSHEQVATLRAEVDFVQSAIAKVGQRIPLAYRYAKLLENYVTQRCGPANGTVTQIAFPRPSEPGILQTLYEESVNTDRNITLHESLHEPGSFISLA
ncbi:hypothetical protein BDN72DRAFT_754042 [Pluteus cervinus]|uniref:Uncharacterized protein n=1 Tax=Pluteus cervinus TaxID=181527 RepID=A0ACD3BFL9_9AGAR|nr:hypothetical protein BDN72DRAFT_754042 [Pluteus cervinus]